MAFQRTNPAWMELGAQGGAPTVPAGVDANAEVAHPGLGRVGEASWTVGTRVSRPGRKAHNCYLSGGTGGVSPAGP